MSDTESQIISREVEVTLGAEELATKRARLVDLEARLETLNETRKKVKAEIDGIETAIIKGSELRAMPCREERDFRLGEKRIVRDDTEEVIERVALSGEERQVPIPEPKTTGRRKKMSKNGTPDEAPGDGEETTGSSPEAH